MIELPLNEIQIREITKKYPGIRYKYDRKGRFAAYAHAGTLLIDLFKLTFKWLTLKRNSNN